MNIAEFQKELNRLGWELTVKPDFRRQDSTLYYEDSLAIEVKKGPYTVQVEAVGDIRIYGKRDSHGEHRHFVFKGGKPSGELTYYLRKHGQWENNNWFEVFMWEKVADANHQRDFSSVIDSVSYTLDEAASNLVESLQVIDKGDSEGQHDDLFDDRTGG